MAAAFAVAIGSFLRAAPPPEAYVVREPKTGVRPGELTLPGADEFTDAPELVAEAVYLARYPDGLPAEDDFGVAKVLLPKPKKGEVLVHTKYLSVDPYMRSSIGGGGKDLPPLDMSDVNISVRLLERVPGGENVGIVNVSRDASFPVGTWVRGHWRWASKAIMPAAFLKPVAHKELATASLGALGMPGRTAYYGLFDILKPQPGEVLFISGAAGATGSVVGQLAKITGARVYGSAGTDEKVAHLLELGFDGAFNYRTEEPAAALQRLMPQGIDMYFENTGGPVSEAVVHLLKDNARIAACGFIHWYNVLSDIRPNVRMGAMVKALFPSSWEAAKQALLRPSEIPRAASLKVITHMSLPFSLRQARYCQREEKRAPSWLTGVNFTYEGLMVNCFDGNGREEKVERELMDLAKSGKLRYREDILQGSMHDVPAAFIRMLAGKNQGKQLVELAEVR